MKYVLIILTLLVSLSALAERIPANFRCHGPAVIYQGGQSDKEISDLEFEVVYLTGPYSTLVIKNPPEEYPLMDIDGDYEGTDAKKEIYRMGNPGREPVRILLHIKRERRKLVGALRVYKNGTEQAPGAWGIESAGSSYDDDTGFQEFNLKCVKLR